MNTDRAISFTNDPGKTDPSTFLLIFDHEGSIDYYSTLKQLCPHDGIRRVIIDEQYSPHTRYDGIELFFRLRLSSFIDINLACAAVILRLTTGKDRIIDFFRTRGLLLFTKGTYFSNVPGIIPSKPQTLLREIREIPFPPSVEKSSHDLSNEWGAHRLLFGYKCLQGRGNDELQIPPIALLKQGYYWRELAIACLTENKKRDINGSDPPGTVIGMKSLSDWFEFLGKQQRSLRVLYIDDEMDKGWGTALRRILGDMGDKFQLTLYPESQSLSINDARDLVKKKWDLLICDVRLVPEDKSSDTYDDIHELKQLHGIELMRATKNIYPDMPVICFTASNKIWTWKYLRDVGVDGLWVKESPQRGLDNKYTVANAAAFLDTVRRVISVKQEIAFLWDLLERLRDAKEQQGYRRKFTRLGLRDIQVIQYLEKIDELIRRTYGFLDYPATTFQKLEFSHDPNDIAFLCLWGIINEILSLRFRLSRTRQSFISANRAVCFWTMGTCVGFVDYLLEATEKRKNERIEYGLSENECISLLLEYENHSSAKFNELRDLRNRLDQIHGRETASRRVTIENILNLSEIIGLLLFL